MTSAMGNVRDVSVAECKYVHVWQRIRYKLKVRFFMVNLLFNGFGSGDDRITPEQKIEAVLNYAGLGKYKKQQAEQIVLASFPRFLFHPDRSSKQIWNIILTILLLYTATLMPYTIAFIESHPWDNWFIFGTIVDSLFAIDF
jgi:hypothetical protein